MTQERANAKGNTATHIKRHIAIMLEAPNYRASSSSNRLGNSGSKVRSVMKATFQHIGRSWNSFVKKRISQYTATDVKRLVGGPLKLRLRHAWVYRESKAEFRQRSLICCSELMSDMRRLVVNRSADMHQFTGNGCEDYKRKTDKASRSLEVYELAAVEVLENNTSIRKAKVRKPAYKCAAMLEIKEIPLPGMRITWPDQAGFKMSCVGILYYRNSNTELYETERRSHSMSRVATPSCHLQLSSFLGRYISEPLCKNVKIMACLHRLLTPSARHISFLCFGVAFLLRLIIPRFICFANADAWREISRPLPSLPPHAIPSILGLIRRLVRPLNNTPSVAKATYQRRDKAAVSRAAFLQSPPRPHYK
ncbi:hypothetical protein PR048_024122 [Dryococelus australis]|uniref:Uncharacterized protein n=1 Tax=Dryococelus australis TaxID=614101 RepID=A0ABQ9GW06_9NEOP|nr:hypothetical protein PR048_024122 [Dryococelus australis]